MWPEDTVEEFQGLESEKKLADTSALWEKCTNGIAHLGFLRRWTPSGLLERHARKLESPDKRQTLSRSTHTVWSRGVHLFSQRGKN